MTCTIVKSSTLLHILLLSGFWLFLMYSVFHNLPSATHIYIRYKRCNYKHCELLKSSYYYSEKWNHSETTGLHTNLFYISRAVLIRLFRGEVDFRNKCCILTTFLIESVKQNCHLISFIYILRFNQNYLAIYFIFIFRPCHIW